ncbi:MAG: hypothetical protein ABMB14_39485 [Myxococcota bacterium]
MERAVATTVDGVSWTDDVVGTAYRSGIAFGDGRFVIGGWPDPVYDSVDGRSWIDLGDGLSDAPIGYTVRFVATGWHDRVYVSDDAVDWTTVKVDSDPVRAGFNDLCFAGER